VLPAESRLYPDRERPDEEAEELELMPMANVLAATNSLLVCEAPEVADAAESSDGGRFRADSAAELSVAASDLPAASVPAAPDGFAFLFFVAAPRCFFAPAAISPAVFMTEPVLSLLLLSAANVWEVMLLLLSRLVLTSFPPGDFW
jgi:hypothetical protein